MSLSQLSFPLKYQILERVSDDILKKLCLSYSDIFLICSDDYLWRQKIKNKYKLRSLPPVSEFINFSANSKYDISPNFSSYRQLYLVLSSSPSPEDYFATSGDVDLISSLVDSNEKEEFFLSLLSPASMSGSIDLVKYLLNKVESSSEKVEGSSEKDLYDNFIKYFEMALFYSGVYGYSKISKILLDKFENIVYNDNRFIARRPMGFFVGLRCYSTGLIETAISSGSEYLLNLIFQNPNMGSKDTFGGSYTIFILEPLILSNRPNDYRRILEKFFTLYGWSKKDIKEGYAYLMQDASFYGNFDLVKYLASKSNDTRFTEVIKGGAESGNIDIVEFALSNLARKSKQKGKVYHKHWRNALIWAAKGNSNDMIRYLFTRATNYGEPYTKSDILAAIDNNTSEETKTLLSSYL